MTLLSRLFVLVAVALLPAIAIQAYNEFDLRRARQVEVQNQTLSLAKLAAAEQQQIVQGIRQVLIAMSEVPAIKTRDSQACDAYLAAMQQRFPASIRFLVTDLNGRSFCNTNSDHLPINIAARPYFADILKNRTFTVGEFSKGLATGRNVIQFALPFYGDDGRMGGVIVAGLGLDWLADYIARKGAPEGAALAITDRNGTYLARYPDNSRLVGKKMRGDKYLNLDQRGAVDILDINGVERIIGYSTLGADSGGLFVGYSVDKAQAFADIQYRTRRDILLIVLSTSLVLVLTLLGARRFIHRPLGQLVNAANQWRLGDYARRVDIADKSEIARVADAFNTMADALEHREHELSEAKEKAEEAAARITTIFESTTDSVVIVDRDWRVSYLNGRAWTQIGEGRDPIGAKLWEAFQDAADTEIFSQLREIMSDQRPASFEAFCPRRGVWYALNAFPSSEGLAVFFRDITEHKQAVEARRLMQDQLHQSQKMESVGQLTGGVAHDFNNLLMVVSANLELIEEAADNGKVRQLAAAARGAANRGAKLTAQLLAFSRRQVLNPKLVDANQLISEFQGLIRQAVGGSCEVKLRTDERFWLCHVDPPLLETALLNLALNGRDAMPDGGVLEIETRNVVLNEGAVAGCLPGSYVKVSVTDTGCGMPPEVRDRVFEPFFTTKEVGKGTGLGLSMVYGFVRQSGGHVAVESAPGVGTTVALYLPKAKQKRDAGVEAIQPQAIPEGSERILVVEDNEDILEVTSAMLTTFGYWVVCARTGAEAIQMFESGREFELLFSDVVMPNGMNGVELAREARRLSKGIKILLTSGYAGDVLERHRAVDEFPIIDKPFRLADLARRLRSIVHEAQDPHVPSLPPRTGTAN
ncbi:ATP-binding protein [Bradyrhizobium erythrophlei]|uniref:histidine kinase n=1 Tax=Bradyrhizobium erythrophlei TaxID=1437360 RepID=A0A1M5RJE5_9BRAD|nr:ATP-binding protein [Bradyrhizobium erythrophlei]SHH26256.1 Signal transduction histidine kinase [Bradyrhizobium erythrophlei]